MRSIHALRRWLLRNFIPEIFWPVNAVLDGVDIPVRSMPYSFGVKRILCAGTYEQSERTLLLEIVRDGDQVLEFGGSIGILATIASTKVGPDGRVVSVEASARLTEHSQKRLSSNPNVRILTGLGFPVTRVPDRFEAGTFVDDGNSLGGHVDFASTDEKPETPVYDIESVSTQCDLQPTILLIDIEASETIYLEDKVTVPTTVRNIVIELHPDMYGEETEHAIVDRICSLGFEMTREISHVFLFTRNV